MGVHITSPSSVALVDSVSQFAFGPTFPSVEQAEDFIAWNATRDESDDLPTTGDLRTYSDAELEELEAAWRAEREAA